MTLQNLLLQGTIGTFYMDASALEKVRETEGGGFRQPDQREEPGKDDGSGLEALRNEHSWLRNESGTMLRFLTADLVELLPEMEKSGEQFDVVILDPPAFAKSRQNVKNAEKGYRKINRAGMRIVKDGGYLATCTCSHFMTRELFEEMLRKAALEAHVRLRQVEARTQAPDHPILWEAKESSYLKFYIFQIVRERRAR